MRLHGTTDRRPDVRARSALGYAIAAAVHLVLFVGLSEDPQQAPPVAQVTPPLTALEPVRQSAPPAAAPVAATLDAGALRALRHELLRRATDAVRAAVAPGARTDAAARADAALRAAEETAQAELEARCAGADPVTSVAADALADDDLAAATDALGRLRARLALAVDPGQVIAAARGAFAGAPPPGPASEAEWIALGAALERARRVFAAFARGEVGARAFASAEQDLAWVRLRAPGRRAPPGRSARFARALQEVGVAGVQALLARGRDGEAVSAAAAFRAAHPISAARSRVDEAEREALARRFERGDAGADERARLRALSRPDAWR